MIVENQRLNSNYITDKNGLVEQEPEWFYQQCVLSCKHLINQAEAKQVNLNELKAVGITTMRNTLIILDEHKQPLRNAIVWSDKRKAGTVPKLPCYLRLAFNIASIVKPVNKTIKELQQRAFINYIAEHEPKVWQQTKHLLLLSGYLNLKCTNKFIDSSANMISHLPFHFKKGKWRNNLSWQFQALAVKPEWLPKLVTPGTEIGQLSQACQIDFNLPKSLPLVAMAADKACEMLGAGCVQAGQLHLSLGTAVSISMLSARFKGPKAFYPAYPSLMSGLYIIEFMLPFGLNLLPEFIKQNSEQLDFLSINKTNQCATEQLIEDHIIENNINSDGLRFSLQDVTHIEQFQLGFADVSQYSVFQQYVAINEAIVQGINQSITQLSQRMQQPVESIMVSGGGAKSKWLLQAIANKTKLKVLKADVDEAGLLGVAIELAVSQRVYNTHQQAVNAMLKQPLMITPNSETG